LVAGVIRVLSELLGLLVRWTSRPRRWLAGAITRRRPAQDRFARWLAGLSVPLSWRRRSLALYRLGFSGALLALGAGFGVMQLREKLGCEPGMPCTAWEETAEERLGTILFVVLVAAALLAAVLIELVIPAAVRIRDRWRGWNRTVVIVTSSRGGPKAVSRGPAGPP
jgi:hypothetical protein